MSSTLDGGSPGFFGKLPAHGDFVTRRLPNEFVTVWDGWLQHVMAVSRTQLGDAWLDAYLVCPIWRFALAPGLCGRPGWLGALMASVDRVGRYYPLTVALPLPERVDGLAGLLLSSHVSHAWFEAVEDAMLAVLGSQGVDAQALGAALQATNAQSVSALLRAHRTFETREDPATNTLCWTWPSATTIHLPDMFLQSRLGELDSRFAPLTAWSSRGSDVRDGEFFAARGLPSATVFCALLGRRAQLVVAPPASLPPDPTPALPQQELIDDPADRTLPKVVAQQPVLSIDDDIRSELAKLLGESPPEGSP